MAYEGLDFGHVKKAIGTFVNRVTGLFIGEKSNEGEAGDDEAGAEIFDSEQWSHFGFDSRPHPEDEMGRCEVIFSRNEDVTICSKDRRYRINLKDGEVGIYTGDKGEITCKQILKPDGTIAVAGKNYGMLLQKKDGDGGEMIVSAEGSVTLTRAGSKTSMITLNEDGGIQAVTGNGSHITMEDSLIETKATVAVEGASVILTGHPGGLMTKAEVSATNISLVGTTSVGPKPNMMPVATVGSMVGPFPITTGSMTLWANFP